MIDNLYSALKRRRCGRAATSESGTNGRGAGNSAPAALAAEVLVLPMVIKVRFLSSPYSNCWGLLVSLMLAQRGGPVFSLPNFFRNSLGGGLLFSGKLHSGFFCSRCGNICLNFAEHLDQLFSAAPRNAHKVDCDGIPPIHWIAPPNLKAMPLTDRKSTRLNSSHLGISYAVFC